MARPRKSCDQESVERRRLAGAHIKEYRSAVGGQEKLAEILGVDVSTIRRYESGKTDIPVKVAEMLAKHSGVIIPYWQGYTDWKTREQWEAYLDEQAAIDAAMDAACEEYEQERRAELERREALFYQCGYRYENLESDPSYAFGGIETPYGLAPPFPHDGPHKLTRYTEPEKSFYFGELEFQSLMANLQRTIDFACFEKERRSKNER